MLWVWARSLGIPVCKMAVIMEPRSRRRLLMAPPLLNRYTSPVFSHRSHFLMNREGQTDDVGAVCLTRSESRKSPFWFVDDSECRLGRGRWCESRRFHLAWGALRSTQNSKVHTQVQQKSLLECILVGFWYLKENYENGMCTRQYFFFFLTHLSA